MNSIALFLWFHLVTPGVGASFDPKGYHLNKIDKGLQGDATKNLSSIPFSFRVEEFWSLSSLSLCSNLWLLEWGQFWPQRNHINNVYEGPQRDAKYQISKLWILPVSEKKNFEVGFLCSYVPTCDPLGGANEHHVNNHILWSPGWARSWPQEYHLNKLGRGPLEDPTYQIWKL